MKPNPTSAVNPSQASIDLLSEWPDDGPIAMLNLLAYNGDAGRAAYGRYGAVASKTVAARGGSVVFMGPVIEPSDTWNTVVLVYYPRRAAYLDMQLDPAYLGAIPDRTAGLRARLLYPFALPQSDVAPTATASGSEVFKLELTQSSPGTDTADPASPGQVVLDLPAGGPGLVTDNPWDHLRVKRCPVAEASNHQGSSTGGNDPDAATRLHLFVQPASVL